VLFLPSSHHLHHKPSSSLPQVSGDRGGISVASKRRNRKKSTPASAASEEMSGAASESSRAESSLESLTESLDFQSIFKNKANTVIEVCSGNGDWIVSRALSQPLVNWVAIEVRVDRCYSIFTRMAFQFVPNLLILCGDARAILQRCVGVARVREVYVNYPEPPGDQENRLLDGRFFGLVARVLEPRVGKLVVVSDDGPCIHGILKALQKCQMLSPVGTPSGLTTSLSSPAASPSEISLEDYGSSYFDKHWKQRHQHERFMLQWGKEVLELNSEEAKQGNDPVKERDKVETHEGEGDEEEAEGDEEGKEQDEAMEGGEDEGE
jgi:tRNA (guanine-N7-)-methyltransferase